MSTIYAVFRGAGFLAAGVALLAMLLMFIGTFTVEWTCREAGSDWKCVGSNCDAEANKRFDTFRRTVSCQRTDWPMAMLDKVGSRLLPDNARQ